MTTVYFFQDWLRWSRSQSSSPFKYTSCWWRNSTTNFFLNFNFSRGYVLKIRMNSTFILIIEVYMCFGVTDQREENISRWLTFPEESSVVNACSVMRDREMTSISKELNFNTNRHKCIILLNFTTALWRTLNINVMRAHTCVDNYKRIQKTGIVIEN